MNHERYLTPNGEVIPHYATNLHHNSWRKKDYPSEFDKRYRNMPGMVLRLTIGTHRDLHANVEPPKKPNPNLMRGIYNYNQRLDVEDPYERFEAITEMLGNISFTSGNTRNRLDAHALHENFTAQLVYINEGKVVPYYGE